MSFRKNYFSDRIRVMNYNRFFMISDTVSVVSGLFFCLISFYKHPIWKRLIEGADAVARGGEA